MTCESAAKCLWSEVNFHNGMEMTPAVSGQAKILVVGEAPGRKEDTVGECFIGPSGDTLRYDVLVRVFRLLATRHPELNWGLNDVAYTNACRCRPPEGERGADTHPDGKHIKYCHPHLVRDIFTADPTLIIGAGSSAATSLLRKKTYINEVRGLTMVLHFQHPDTGEVRTYPVLFAYHPAYVKRQGAKESAAMALDILRAIDYLQAEEHENDYRIARTEDDLRSVIQYVKGAPLLSVDIEATSLTPHRQVFPYRVEDHMIIPGQQVLGVGFSTTPDTGWYVPINHVEVSEEFKALTRRVIKAILESSIPKIGHNLKYDYHYLRVQEDITIANIVHDTMIQAHYLDSRDAKGLKVLAFKYSNKPKYEDALDTQIEIEKATQKEHFKVAAAAITKILKALPAGVDEENAKTFRKEFRAPAVLKFLGIATRPLANLSNNEIFDGVANSLVKSKAFFQTTKDAYLAWLEQHDLTALFNTVQYAWHILNHEKPLWCLPLDNVGWYGCADVDVTLQVHNQQIAALRAHSAFESYTTVSVPLTSVLGDMETRGVLVDQQAVRNIAVTLADLVRTAKKSLLLNPYFAKYLEQHGEYNPRSDKQVQRLFFQRDFLDFPPVAVTKTNNPSLAKEARTTYLTHLRSAVIEEFATAVVELPEEFATAFQRWAKKNDAENTRDNWRLWLYAETLAEPLAVIEETSEEIAEEVAWDATVTLGALCDYLLQRQDIPAEGTTLKDLLDGASATNCGWLVLCQAQALFYQSVMRVCKDTGSKLVVPLSKFKDSSGRIHTLYKITGTQTYRLSSGDTRNSDAPNLQNIPKFSLFKDVFVAAPGYAFVRADLSQAELRVGAVIARDRNMLEIFRTMGDTGDIHQTTASKVFHLPMEETGKGTKYRQAAKSINFRIFYGGTAQGLARQVGCPLAEAEQFYMDYFSEFPGVAAYINKQTQASRTTKEAVGLFGHKRFTDSATELINMPVQNTASILASSALVAIDKALHQRYTEEEAHLLLTTHDDVVVECQEALVGDVALLVKQHMEHPPIYKGEITAVPLKSDLEVGHRLGSMEEFLDKA